MGVKLAKIINIFRRGMYKLISIDMDKTLLNDEHKISRKTLESIKEAKEKGCAVVLNTGRTFSEMALYLEELRFMEKFILCNGALFYEADKDKFTNLESVKNMVIYRVFDLSKEHCKEISLVVSSERYSYTDNIYLGGKGAKQHFDMCGDILDYVYDLKSVLSGKRIEKGVMFGNPEILKMIQSEISRDFPNDVNAVFSLDNALEIISKNTDKGIALEKVSRILGIRQSETIAIGDGINDFGMIKYAGLGVAMGNAKEEIKSISDFVTKSNNEDGIAYAIEKFIR